VVERALPLGALVLPGVSYSYETPGRRLAPPPIRGLPLDRVLATSLTGWGVSTYQRALYYHTASLPSRIGVQLESRTCSGQKITTPSSVESLLGGRSPVQLRLAGRVWVGRVSRVWWRALCNQLTSVVCRATAPAAIGTGVGRERGGGLARWVASVVDRFGVLFPFAIPERDRFPLQFCTVSRGSDARGFATRWALCSSRAGRSARPHSPPAGSRRWWGRPASRSTRPPPRRPPRWDRRAAPDGRWPCTRRSSEVPRPCATPRTRHTHTQPCEVCRTCTVRYLLRPYAHTHTHAHTHTAP
jgi:hypothetical protein